VCEVCFVEGCIFCVVSGLVYVTKVILCSFINLLHGNRYHISYKLKVRRKYCTTLRHNESPSYIVLVLQVRRRGK